MNKKNFWLYAVTFVFFVFIIFCFGCGLIAVFGTGSPSEKKIPAEFRLAEYKDKMILVLVKQPAWLGAPPTLRGALTDLVNKKLAENVKFQTSNIIDYQTLSDFRSKRVDFFMMSEVEIGKALGADLVLLLSLDGYNLNKLPDTEYYNGSLDGRSVLIDVQNNKKLFPEAESAKIVRVGFDVEVRGAELALLRLANSVAHCVTRYLYDCPIRKFKIADDRSGVGWESWDD